MKKSKVLFLIWCLVLYMPVAWSQQPQKGSGRITVEPLKESKATTIDQRVQSGGLAASSHLEGEPGSLYMDPDWQEGIIIMKDKKEITGNLFRYNLYTQQMQFTNGTDTLAIGNPNEIETIRFGNKTFIYASYEFHGKKANGYFELIADGKCKLLKRWIIQYEVPAQGGETQQSRSEDNPSYLRNCNGFIQFAGESAIPVPGSTREFCGSFPGYEDQLLNFIKKNDLKIKRENDLISVIGFYNSLP